MRMIGLVRTTAQQHDYSIHNNRNDEAVAEEDEHRESEKKYNHTHKYSE